jgi:hypothetical protein
MKPKTRKVRKTLLLANWQEDVNVLPSPDKVIACVARVKSCHSVGGHEQDLDVYNKAAVNTAKKYFNIPDIDDYYKKVAPKPLVFCHFARGLADKVYNEVLDYPSMYKTVKEVCALLPSTLKTLKP